MGVGDGLAFARGLFFAEVFFAAVFFAVVFLAAVFFVACAPVVERADGTWRADAGLGLRPGAGVAAGVPGLATGPGDALRCRTPGLSSSPDSTPSPFVSCSRND